MSTEQYIYDSVYDIINAIVNVGGGTIPIIQAYQDAPPPKIYPYISIGLPILNVEGWSTTSDVDINGKIQRTNHYSVSMSIWQTGGLGEHLRNLVHEFETQENKDIFKTKKIGTLNRPSLIFLPRIEEKETIREWTIELLLSVGVAHEETTSWIETTSYINNITK